MRYKRMLSTGRWFTKDRPKTVSTGYWFEVPKLLQHNDVAFVEDYYSRIEALVCLRSYLSTADPLTLAVSLDHITLYRCVRRGGPRNLTKRTHVQPLTLAEKRFVAKGVSCAK